jgi:hypothetical protein
MTAKKTAQSSKAKPKLKPKAKAAPKAKAQKPDAATAFAEDFFGLWQKQWQELIHQKGMPSPESMGLPPGFVPLQNIGPMGLMAPMGAVAMANLKMLQDLQQRVKELEAQLTKASKRK